MIKITGSIILVQSFICDYKPRSILHDLFVSKTVNSLTHSDTKPPTDLWTHSLQATSILSYCSMCCCQCLLSCTVFKKKEKESHFKNHITRRSWQESLNLRYTATIPILLSKQWISKVLVRQTAQIHAKADLCLCYSHIYWPTEDTHQGIQW